LKRKAIFHHLAEIELNDAAEYYEKERSGLGVAFLGEVERAIEYVLQYPEGSPLVAETVRRKLIRRFPYSLLYSIHTDCIRILTMMNQKRRPFYWRGRK